LLAIDRFAPVQALHVIAERFFQQMLPIAVGVPDRTPPLLKFRPGGSAPPVTPKV